MADLDLAWASHAELLKAGKRLLTCTNLVLRILPRMLGGQLSLRQTDDVLKCRLIADGGLLRAENPKRNFLDDFKRGVPDFSRQKVVHLLFPVSGSTRLLTPASPVSSLEARECLAQVKTLQNLPAKHSCLYVQQCKV